MKIDWLDLLENVFSLQEKSINKALNDFDLNNMPDHSYGVYPDSVYDKLYPDGEI